MIHYKAAFSDVILQQKPGRVECLHANFINQIESWVSLFSNNKNNVSTTSMKTV